MIDGYPNATVRPCDKAEAADDGTCRAAPGEARCRHMFFPLLLVSRPPLILLLLLPPSLLAHKRRSECLIPEACLFLCSADLARSHKAPQACAHTHIPPFHVGATCDRLLSGPSSPISSTHTSSDSHADSVHMLRFTCTCRFSCRRPSAAGARRGETDTAERATQPNARLACWNGAGASYVVVDQWWKVVSERMTQDPTLWSCRMMATQARGSQRAEAD